MANAAYIDGQMPVQNPNPGFQIEPPPNANPPVGGVNRFTAACIGGQMPPNGNPGIQIAHPMPSQQAVVESTG